MKSDTIIKSGTATFRIQDKFINDMARQLLIEGEIEKAISFLKNLTDEENIIADVIFGRKQFKEKGKTQNFCLIDDNATSQCSLTLNVSDVVRRFWLKRKDIEKLAKVYKIKIPKVEGTFSSNAEINRVMQAKKNFMVADRCCDEILHPNWFVLYKTGNPMNTRYFQKGTEHIKKYDRLVRKSNYVTVSPYGFRNFFTTLTNSFELQTEFDIVTYNPQEVCELLTNEPEWREPAPLDVYIDQKMPEEPEIPHKPYFTGQPDNLKLPDGFIDKEGNWYSVYSQGHELFAREYLEIRHPNQNKERSAKDFMAKKLGWICVTIGMLGIYVIGGRYNRKQRQTLQKWMKKYKIKEFDPMGDMDSDFIGNVKNVDDPWFDGGRC